MWTRSAAQKAAKTRVPLPQVESGAKIDGMENTVNHTRFNRNRAQETCRICVEKQGPSHTNRVLVLRAQRFTITKLACKQAGQAAIEVRLHTRELSSSRSFNFLVSSPMK
jgi:ethanolamine ammonia-lyase small subunit